MLLNYGVYLTIWISSISIAKLPAIDHDDVGGIFFSSTYLSDKLTFKLSENLMVPGLDV